MTEVEVDWPVAKYLAYWLHLPQWLHNQCRPDAVWRDLDTLEISNRKATYRVLIDSPWDGRMYVRVLL